MRSAWLASPTGRALVLLGTWVVAVGYVASLVDRGWGPPDEGLLGQTAERFLAGQLPHRDFDDLYTGGLTVLHGIAFSLFGTRLLSLRFVLLSAVILWVPFVYLMARRFLPPLGAAGLTLVAVSWSIPAYPASMPSWYNLFLATVAVWALLKHIESSRLGWVFLAGLASGASILAKITGVYVVGASILVLLYCAYARIGPPASPPTPSAVGRAKGSAGSWLGLVTGVLGLTCLVVLLASARDAGTWLLLFTPPAMMCAVLIMVTWLQGEPRWRAVWHPLLALALGAGVGVSPLVFLYTAQGALPELIQGLVVLPRQRLEFASLAPNPVSLAYVAVLGAVVLLAQQWYHPRLGRLLALLVAAVGLWLLAFGHRSEGLGGIGGSGAVYGAVVGSLSGSMPLIGLALTAVVGLRLRGETPGQSEASAYAVVAVAAFSALVGFPYSNDLYFHYVAPLILLAGAAVVRVSARPTDSRILGVLMSFYAAFALLHVAVTPASKLAVERGGIRVPAGDSAQVEQFVRLMHAVARGKYTYATPDAPEAYFLTGLLNPTRTMYEFYDPDDWQTERILEVLDRHEVTAVAVSQWRIFSGRPSGDLLAALEERYPFAVPVWHFTVRWREPE